MSLNGVRDSRVKWVSGQIPCSLHDQRMNTIMKLDNLIAIEQMEAFLNGSQAIAFAVSTRNNSAVVYQRNT